MMAFYRSGVSDKTHALLETLDDIGNEEGRKLEQLS